MKATLIFSQFFLPLTSIKLGHFVTDVKNPHQDYRDPPSVNPPTRQCHSATITDNYSKKERVPVFPLHSRRYSRLDSPNAPILMYE